MSTCMFLLIMLLVHAPYIVWTFCLHKHGLLLANIAMAESEEDKTVRNVFISYGRETDVTSFVKQLKKDLEANGYTVWLDLESIPSGMAPSALDCTSVPPSSPSSHRSTSALVTAWTSSTQQTGTKSGSSPSCIRMWTWLTLKRAELSSSSWVGSTGAYFDLVRTTTASRCNAW